MKKSLFLKELSKKNFYYRVN